MRPPRLSLVLVLVIAGLLAAATGTVAWSAGRILAAEAEERALATVELDAASIAAAIQRDRDALAALAGRLANDRTVVHLAAASPGLRRTLDAYLDRNRGDAVATIRTGASRRHCHLRRFPGPAPASPGRRARTLCPARPQAAAPHATPSAVPHSHRRESSGPARAATPA